MTSVQLPPDYLEQVTIRLLADALASATSGYWERRASVLEAARHRSGDWPGQATPEALAARRDRLTADALECRRHAALFDHDDIDAGLIREVLGWPAVDETEARRAA